jgi:hypothetical protein
MKGKDLSQGRMSRETGVSYGTVKKYLRQMEAPPGALKPFADGMGRV